MLQKARSYADAAVCLAPTKACSQSAFAFVNMFERNFQEAIASLLEAAKNGAPMSKISAARLIAPLGANKRHIEPNRYFKQFIKAWPDSRIEELMLRLFRSKTHADNLIDHMKAAELGDLARTRKV